MIIEEVRGAKSACWCSLITAGRSCSSPPFLSRERAPVSVDVDPERCSPGDETCFALETVQESRLATGKRCSVWWWRLIRARSDHAHRVTHRHVQDLEDDQNDHKRSVSSPGAQVETAGPGAHSDCDPMCWQWLVRRQSIQLPVIMITLHLQSGCPGEAAPRSDASSSAQHMPHSVVE